MAGAESAVFADIFAAITAITAIAAIAGIAGIPTLRL